MFYTFQMTVVDGQTAVGAFERVDKKTALSAYHSTIASALANPNCTKCLCMVFDQFGQTIEPPFHWEAEHTEE